MKEIQLSDVTLALSSSAEQPLLTFRGKIEAAKLLDRSGVSMIELGRVTGSISDNLLIKSVASSVKESRLAVNAGLEAGIIGKTWEALKEARLPRLQVCAAVSAARMEYVYHKKADAMLQTAVEAIGTCRKLCDDVEFIAEDATRADTDYLCRILREVIAAGVGTVTICDTAGSMLPDEFGAFLRSLYAQVPELAEVTVGVSCTDTLGMANAAAVAAIREGASLVKTTALSFGGTALSTMAKVLSDKSETLGVSCAVQTTELNRILKSVQRLCSKSETENSPFEDGVRSHPENVFFTSASSLDEIMKQVAVLGYDPDDNDKMRIWNAFLKIIQRKKQIGIGELEAIIASEAMQVPATYVLENYVVTTGNAIGILAHVKLKKDDKFFDGLSLGDGPIDAAFLAIEQITGHHYELDDFQIQAITEGREAMGQTIVKLRSGGKVFSGRGISTDIIGSGVAAYVNALNKILYEEETV